MSDALQTEQQTEQPASQPPGRTRNIFRYFDGVKNRGIDPILVVRRLALHPKFDTETHWALATSEKPDFEALGTVVDGVRDVFEVEAWSEDDTGQERGLTDQECIRLFIDYSAFMEGLKKNGEPSQTGQPPTDQPACRPSNQASNTSDSLASGSTSDAPKPVAPGPS